MTVYVIDDHPLMREALTMLVQRVRPGLKVVPVAKLNVLESTVERQGPPQLICLDLKLPDTMGLSGVHAVHAKFPDVPLVIVTEIEREVRVDETRSSAAGTSSTRPTVSISSTATTSGCSARATCATSCATTSTASCGCT